ncbi:hypothetical protein [Dactylosporangium sp. NPDC005555]|uniref:hypothetical protein n=1 Tax=Dactylosporangium sp. NPDC005555 TaxID=3154889 RepID=UPI00339EFCCD
MAATTAGGLKASLLNPASIVPNDECNRALGRETVEPDHRHRTEFTSRTRSALAAEADTKIISIDRKREGGEHRFAA